MFYSFYYFRNMKILFCIFFLLLPFHTLCTNINNHKIQTTMKGETSTTIVTEHNHKTKSTIGIQQNNQLNKKKLTAKQTNNTMTLLLIMIMLETVFIMKKKHDDTKSLQQRYKQDKELTAQTLKNLRMQLKHTEKERMSLAEKYHKTVCELNSLQCNINAASVEEKLHTSPITKRFKQIAANPLLHPTKEEWHEMRNMFNNVIPLFYSTLNCHHTLRPDEYDLCILVRLQFKTLEMSNLMGCSRQNISAMRRRMMLKLLGQEGSPKEFDKYIMSITK